MRRHGHPTTPIKSDMTPMMDVCFQLIIFFILLMTIAKDENAQRVKLPIAPTPPILEDEQIPNSLNINIDPEGTLWSWGAPINLRSADGLDKFRAAITSQANVLKAEQKQRGSDWKTDGLDTTLIIRVSADIEFELFEKVMNVCRDLGFVKYHLQARKEED